MAKYTKREQESAMAYMKKTLARRKMLWTHVESVAKSGSNRIISVYAISNNEPNRVSFEIAKILDYTWDDRTGGIRVPGGGMDMEFGVVYYLSQKLYGDGHKIKQRSM